MGNLHESFRQRMEEEKRKTVQREAERLQWIEEEKARELEGVRREQLKREALKKEQREMLGQFKAKELLEEIKRDVWHLGVVVESPKDNEQIGFELRFDYQGVVRDVRATGSGSPDRGGGSVIHGEKGHIDSITTKLAILATNLKAWGGNDRPGLFVLDTEVWVKGEVDPERPEAPQMIEDLLLQSCVERQKTGKLPLQLRAEGEREISKRVPWNRRIFR